MKKQIWFVRHAQSVTNAGGTWPDPDTIPLTETGQAQAQAVSEVLDHSPTLIVTSPYTRTLETARPTLERWPGADHEEWPVHEFTYLCSDKLRNASFNEFLEHDQIYWERQDPHHEDGPEAESYIRFLDRIDETVQRIEDMNHEKAIVFSHALFLKALFYRLENSDADMRSIIEFKTVFLKHRISNTAIAHFSFHPNGDIEMHGLSVDHLDEEHR